jgi:CHASE3 domain sensor protein
VEQAQQVRVELARALWQTEDIETGARGFVVSGEPAYLELLHENRRCQLAERSRASGD